jgi:hypothetical protein
VRKGCTLTLRAESAARAAPFARGRDPEAMSKKPAWKRRVCMPAGAGVASLSSRRDDGWRGRDNQGRSEMLDHQGLSQSFSAPDL